MAPKYIITPAQAGKRLDQILGAIYPALGLRARRRLLSQALLNKKIVRSGIRPRLNDILELPDFNLPDQLINPEIIKKTGQWIFYFKPAGIHTCILAGQKNDSLEWRIQASNNALSINLVQRLDRDTCGIIAAVADEKKVAEFREAEKAGNCDKYYLALLQGKMQENMIAQWVLNTANRKKTGIIRECAPKERWTWFMPLPQAINNIPDLSWVLCKIKRGQRHQIRAHAAALGYPLAGDALYGSGAGDFCLRHFYISFSDIECFFLDNIQGSFFIAPELAQAIKQKYPVFSSY